MLLGLKTRCSRVEQLILVLIMAARKLRPYFQAHIAIVLARQPLKLILIKPDIFGRIIRWSIELSELDLKYIPKMVIKAQALSEFIIE